MIIERAVALRAKIEEFVTALDDEEALEVLEFFPNWKVGEVYDVGDRKRYNGVLYKCLISHTSQNSWNPEDAVSLWARVLIPDPEIINDWIQPDSTNPYMKGDKVRYDNKVWVSDIDNNVWRPGEYGWTEIIETT